MKFRLLFILIAGLVCLVPYLIYQKYQQDLRAPDVVPEVFATSTEPLLYQSFSTTQEVAAALENPPVYVESFPSDFNKRGTPELFIKVLLPYIQYYNRQILSDRQQLIVIANKLWAHEPLTKEETTLFLQLAALYDVNTEVDAGGAFHLLEKVNAIPPAVALAVALVETEGGKKYLDAPFGVFVWDQNKRYVRASYLDLGAAYYAWMYQMNTADAHASFREERRPSISSYLLLKSLPSLRPYDGKYVKALTDAYKRYNLARFEEKDEDDS